MGDKTHCYNYRDVSLLPATYKILSNILLSRLITYAEEITGDHQSVERSPTSRRRISTRIDVPHTSQHGLYPIHLQMAQRLEERDETILDFCRWVIVDRRLIPFILLPDEASFTRDDINNTHNSHRWPDKNLPAIVEGNSQHRFSVNVWCGVIDNQLIGPVLPNRLTGRTYADTAQRASPIIGGCSFC
jgi:hypothetical protein